jgi:cell division protein FtsZ
VSIQSSGDIRFNEFTEAMETITTVVGSQANVFIGTSVSDGMDEELKVTVIATGFGETGVREPEEIQLGSDEEEADYPFARGQSGREHEKVPGRAQSRNPRLDPQRTQLPPFLRRTID